MESISNNCFTWLNCQNFERIPLITRSCNTFLRTAKIAMNWVALIPGQEASSKKILVSLRVLKAPCFLVSFFVDLAKLKKLTQELQNQTAYGNPFSLAHLFLILGVRVCKVVGWAVGASLIKLSSGAFFQLKIVMNLMTFVHVFSKTGIALYHKKSSIEILHIVIRLVTTLTSIYSVIYNPALELHIPKLALQTMAIGLTYF